MFHPQPSKGSIVLIILAMLVLSACAGGTPQVLFPASVSLNADHLALPAPAPAAEAGDAAVERGTKYLFAVHYMDSAFKDGPYKQRFEHDVQAFVASLPDIQAAYAARGLEELQFQPISPKQLKAEDISSRDNYNPMVIETAGYMFWGIATFQGIPPSPASEAGAFVREIFYRPEMGGMNQINGPYRWTAWTIDGDAESRGFEFRSLKFLTNGASGGHI